MQRGLSFSRFKIQNSRFKKLYLFIFYSRNSQSRENINFPEDESVGGAEGDVSGGEHSSPGKERHPEDTVS